MRIRIRELFASKKTLGSEFSSDADFRFWRVAARTIQTRGFQSIKPHHRNIVGIIF